MKSVLFSVMLILLSVSTIFTQQAAGAKSYSFIDIFYPGATYIEVNGINNSGQVVGWYEDGNNYQYHGFIYSGGAFSPLDHPSATDTEVYGISNNGLIVGKWYNSSGSAYIFVRSSSGIFTTIYPPDDPYGINSNRTVVGSYNDAAGTHGFVFSGGGLITLDYPGATETMAWGINDKGKVAGEYWSPPENNRIKIHGFVVTGSNFSNFTTIDYPGVNSCYASGVNNNGQVAGAYTDLTGGSHGFVYSGGNFTTLDYPGAKDTWANGINDNGDVVGGWWDGDYYHGFLASLSYSISGTVKNRKGTPVEDVTITLGGTSSDTTKTAFDGTYSFSNLKSGPYTITPSKDKYTFKPKSISATITTNDLVSQDFTLQTFSISGAVKDKKGEPVGGISMGLTGESSDTAETASDGTYSFEDLSNGSYTVTPTPTTEWYYFKPLFRVVAVNGQDVTGQNFTAKTPYQISGKVLQGIDPVPGVTMTLSGTANDQVTTDTDGTYQFSGLREGSYVVTPSLTGYAFKPASRTVGIQGSDIADVDFSALALPFYLLSPNGGESIASGSKFNIQWEVKSPDVVKFKLAYSLDNGLTWIPIPKTADFITGTSYDWTVPTLLGNKKKCLVKVIGYNASNIKVGSDISDAPFTIEVVKLESPNGGMTYKSGDPLAITWTTNATKNDVIKVKLYYTKDGGVTWTLISTLTDASYISIGPHSYNNWKPTVKTNSNKCKVKVELIDKAGNILGTDVSDSYFTIQP